MDIGDSFEAATSCLGQWNEFHGTVNVSGIEFNSQSSRELLLGLQQLIGQQICATIAVGEELLEANHYASQQIGELTGSLSSQWESFCRLLQERVGLLEYSVNFHEKLQSVSKILYCTFRLNLSVSVKF